MKTAVIGGGILGLTLALRLAKQGWSVDLIEAADHLGGLARPYDYGEFIWDEFYHCILPGDRGLLNLIDELGLSGELHWTKTETGYWGGGEIHPMSGTGDFIRFPLLNPVQKARLAWSVLRAKMIKDPGPLHAITAEAWLIRLCGRRTYEVFWKPLLRSKFGELHDRIDASFMWATITRLFGAREKGANTECLGYVSGGYRRILERFTDHLRNLGVRIQTGAPVSQVDEVPGPPDRCRVRFGDADAEFDRVYFTAPTALARRVAGTGLQPFLDEYEACYPASQHYLGVVTLNLVLARPLTPYYVVNIGGEDTGLTGIVEVTNLVDRTVETANRSLVYLPRYLPSESVLFDEPDKRWEERLLDRGLRRIFPDLADDEILDRTVHRARRVQALPLAGEEGARRVEMRQRGAFQILNTAQLQWSTLNNSAVIDLVGEHSIPNGSAR